MDDEELTRIRRRAEIMPSDDGSSDEVNQPNGGWLASNDEGSSDDGSSDEDAPGGADRAGIGGAQAGKKNSNDGNEGRAIGKEGRKDIEVGFSEDESEGESDTPSEDESEDDQGPKRSSKQQLRDIPLHERLAMKLNGGDGAISVRWEPKAGERNDDWGYGTEEVLPAGKGRKRDKNAPMEMSTKWAVGRHREVIEVQKSKARDPRFEEEGTTSMSAARAEDAYKFLEEKRQKELSSLELAIRRENRRRGGRAGGVESKVEVLKKAAARLKQVEGEQARERARRNALESWKKTEKAKVAAGKAPYYLKRKAAKEMVLENQFSELSKGKGGKRRVEKKVEKRRKRNAAHERKWMPDTRGQRTVNEAP